MSSISSMGGGASAFQNAELGISRGMANMARDQQVVAGGGGAASGGIDSMTNALVDAKQQQLNVEASARALSIADKTLGTLVDIKA
jgi:hypothetical protein